MNVNALRSPGNMRDVGHSRAVEVVHSDASGLDTITVQSSQLKVYVPLLFPMFFVQVPTLATHVTSFRLLYISLLITHPSLYHLHHRRDKPD
jgi:hypothetical protein